MTVNIQRATVADKPYVVGLLASQLHEHQIDVAHATLAREVDGILEVAERGTLLLAIMAGKPVGVAYLAYTWTLEHGGKVGWLEELYVEPEHRERGIGSALLTAVCDRARAEGCGAVDLEVDANHERAAHLYERRGFRRLARTRFVLRL